MRQARPRHARVFLQYPCQVRTGAVVRGAERLFQLSLPCGIRDRASPVTGRASRRLPPVPFPGRQSRKAQAARFSRGPPARTWASFLQHHRHQSSRASASVGRCRWSLADSSSTLAIHSRRRFCSAKLPAIPAKMLRASSSTNRQRLGYFLQRPCPAFLEARLGVCSHRLTPRSCVGPTENRGFPPPRQTSEE